MKKILFTILACAFLAFAGEAQTMPSPSPTPNATTEAKPKAKKFRSNKDQVMQTQKMLKVAESGKMDAATKTAVNARYTIS